MMKPLALAGACILAVTSLAGCSPTATKQFAQNAATTVEAINTVNTALIQLDTNIIANTATLAGALAKINCPIVNASVALGAAISADPNVAASVKTKLTAAGSGGALASDVCAAAGYGPTTPAAAVPASVPVTPTATPAPAASPSAS